MHYVHYFFNSILPLPITIAAAIFSGIRFARIGTILEKETPRKDQDIVLLLAQGLGAFVIPFYFSPSDKLRSTVSFFIVLTSMSMIIARGCMRQADSSGKTTNTDTEETCDR